MLDFVQQLVSGIALGCVYGLIALGFVLVYKATEVVNFAQGDLMMLGGFFAFTFIGMLGLNYWIGFAGAVIAMALFGMLAERVVVRPILGYPQFSIIMATIGLGYFLRSVVGMIWGTDDFKIETPFSQGVLRIGSLVLAYDKLSVIAATIILCALLYLFFNRTTLGTAMRASSENMLAAYYMGIPVKRVVSIVWAISAAVATCAGVLLAPITFIHSNVGLVLGLKAFPAAVLGGFGSIPGAVVGGVHDRRDREHGRLLPAAGLEGRRALHRAAGGAAAQARRPVRGSYAEEGLMRFLFKTDYEDDIRLFPHSGYIVSYGVLLALLVIAPFVLSSYIVSQLVFVCIYATVGVGLMILTGFTGQASLGHAAFLAIGAYTAAYLQQFNVPFPVYFLAAGLLTGVVGALVGFPALRLQGIYLVIATISFAFIVEEILARWESVTHGNEGMRVKTMSLFGSAVPRDRPAFYFLCLGGADPDHRRHAQPAALADRARLRRHPRQRDRGAQHGHQRLALQGEVVCDQRGDHRLCRRAVRPQAVLHQPGNVHAAALDRVHHRHPDRRHLQPARRGAGRDLHGHDRSVPDLPEGRRARHHRRRCRDVRRGQGDGGQHPDQRRGVCVRQRPEGRDLRHHHRAVRAVRAARPLRALAEDQTLLPAVPALQARHLQAAEDLREIGAEPVSYFRAENLSLHFGGLKAVDSVSFAVEKGEILSIIGPNGAGKSSIFNLISRIYPPTSGKIYFEDQDITQRPAYEIAGLGIARTFQNIELFENATMLSNLLVGRHRHSTTQLWQELLFLPSVRANEKAHRRRVEQVIEFLDLEAYRDKLISGLPYGVRKVIELARALCSEPKLILLDEPSSGLNVEETDDMSFWIRDMKTELGITVLMVEHDMTLVNRVSDRVIALNYGRVLAMGSPSEVQRHPDVVAAYLGA